MMVDYVIEMTVKKSCKYGEHGSLEHLLLLLCKLVFYSGDGMTTVLCYSRQTGSVVCFACSGQAVEIMLH